MLGGLCVFNCNIYCIGVSVCLWVSLCMCLCACVFFCIWYCGLFRREERRVSLSGVRVYFENLSSLYLLCVRLWIWIWGGIWICVWDYLLCVILCLIYQCYQTPFCWCWFAMWLINLKDWFVISKISLILVLTCAKLSAVNAVNYSRLANLIHLFGELGLWIINWPIFFNDLILDESHPSGCPAYWPKTIQAICFSTQSEHGGNNWSICIWAQHKSDDSFFTC